MRVFLVLENVVPTKFGRCYKVGTRTGPSEEGKDRVSDAASPIIGNSDTEVAGQDEVLWRFGGVRWVSRQNPESHSHEVSHEKIVKKYFENNFRFAKSNSYISVVP